MSAFNPGVAAGAGGERDHDREEGGGRPARRLRRLDAGLGADFDAFVLRSSPRLLRTAYLLARDTGHAEDLVQLTLLRTARRWSAARAAPDAYARQVLLNLARDRWRLLGRRPVEVSGEARGRDPAAQPDPAYADLADQLADRDTLLRAMRLLPWRQREVVVLRYWEGLSVEETAELIGCSAGAVKAYGSRGLARLRELIGERSERAEMPHGE